MMAREFRSFDFSRMPAKESYALLSAFIQPRPIAFVSTISLKGVLNLAPFSFFMAGGSNPPSICYSPTLAAGGSEKDSLRNVRETGEFVVNTVHREMAEGMNATSAPFLPDQSEWEPSGFTAIDSELVRPPRVAESYAQMECKLFEIVEHGDGVGSARYVIGEVVRFHALDSLWQEEQLVEAQIGAIGRMGGPRYIDTAGLVNFELDRP